MNPYTIIFAIAFSIACFGVGYKKGGDSVQAKWDRNKAEISEAIGKQNLANWSKERALNASVNQLRNDYAKEKSTRLASDAQLDSVLRDFNTAIAAGAANPTPTTSSGADGAGGIESDLLRECAAVVVGLGKEAGRLADKVVGLQAYINAIGANK